MKIITLSMLAILVATSAIADPAEVPANPRAPTPDCSAVSQQANDIITSVRAQRERLADEAAVTQVKITALTREIDDLKKKIAAETKTDKK